jgi:hypothetical protein
MTGNQIIYLSFDESCLTFRAKLLRALRARLQLQAKRFGGHAIVGPEDTRERT